MLIVLVIAGYHTNKFLYNIFFRIVEFTSILYRLFWNLYIIMYHYI